MSQIVWNFPKLRPNQQKGSKPRCHLLTQGTDVEVSARLTALVAPFGSVRSTDRWMPAGFEDCAEAQLHSAAALLPNPHHRQQLKNWWLAAATERITTPNIDLASTCLVDGKKGLLLVEAKAHDAELRNEERGKPLAVETSRDSLENHHQIGNAIELASRALSTETGLTWSLSRDTRYQMSNRFAWAWKLTELGIPVLLVYLGFTQSDEMRNGKMQQPIVGNDEWDAMVRLHSRPLFPAEVWNQGWQVHGQSFIPLIRTINVPLTSVSCST